MSASMPAPSTEELLAWRLEHEAAAHERLAKKAEELGCVGNLQLAEYVLGLESRLDRLEERFES